MARIIMQDDDAYHRDATRMSRSKLWTLYTKSPAHAAAPEEQEEESAALRFGKLCHFAVLQPMLVPQFYKVGPKVSKQTNAWKAAVVEASAQGMTLITLEEYDKAMWMAQEAHKEQIIRDLIQGAEVERTYHWQDEETKVEMKSRPDIYNPRLMLAGDYKTTASAAPRDFARSVANYGYHLQEFVYTMGINRIPERQCEGMVFLVQEKEAPYVMQVYELSPYWLEEAGLVYARALERWTQCLKTGRFPAYAEGVQTLEPPAWALKETFRDPTQE